MISETPESALILRDVCAALLSQKVVEARAFISTRYPFSGAPAQARRYSEIEKTRLFLRDGFIDRYTGKKLVFIGTLRLISLLLPEVFPYHPNWKMENCHPAYWELSPTLDHLIPVTRGGLDEPTNWVTTSMLTNAHKANWTLEELGWRLLPPGSTDEWDGLISIFMQLADANASLRSLPVIHRYYRAVKVALET